VNWFLKRWNSLDQSTKRYIYVVITIALILRLGYVFTVDLIPDNVIDIDMDAVEYDHLGWNISKGIGVIDACGYPTALRFPTYLYFLGLIYFLFGHYHMVVLVIHAIIGTSIPILLYFTSRHLFSERVSRIAGVLGVIYPVFIWFTGWLMTENLFLPLLTLLMYLTVSLGREATWKRLVFIGFVVGLLSLTRGIGLPFLGLIPFYIFLRLQGTIPKKFFQASLVLASTIIVMIPWTVRNYMTYDRIMLPSSEGGIILWMSFFPISLEEWYKPDVAFEYVKKVGRENATSEEFYKILADNNLFGTKGLRIVVQKYYPGEPLPNNDVEAGEFFGNIAKKEMFKNPAGLVVKSIIQVFRFWHVLDERGRFVNGYAFIIPFFFAGFWMTRKRIIELLPLYLFPLVLMGISILFFADARFRMPFETVFIIIGAFAMERFIRVFKQPAIGYGLLTLFFLLTYFMRMHSEEVRAGIRSILGAMGVPLV